MSLRRATCRLVLGLALGLCVAAARADEAGRALLTDVARHYGLDQFHTIEKMVFTFHVTLPDGKLVERSWVWRPRTTELMYVGDNPDGMLVRTNMFRNQLTNAAPLFHHKVEAMFINDTHWLFFPIAAVWDPKADAVDGGSAAMPISGAPGRKLTVRYPSDADGRTGDVYVLYLDPDLTIREWAFHPGGAAQPKIVTTWDEYARMGPLLLSLSHHNADNTFKLWFTDVLVTNRKDQAGSIPTASEWTTSRHRGDSQNGADASK